jgi:predicted O-methyltransferase YrrM
MANEPATDGEARAWIGERIGVLDPFVWIAEATEAHRQEHGCEAYASADGSLLGVLAAASGAKRILEIGTALGYSAAWLAASAPAARVISVDADLAHIVLARPNLERAGLLDRVMLMIARFPDAAGQLGEPFDLVFYDAAVPGMADLDAMRRLLRQGGMLVTSNLFLGRYGLPAEELDRGAEVRETLLDSSQWLTSFAEFKAISIKR